jgi:hypothetical protein
MPEVLTCPSCQRKLQVPESLVGQDVQCPTCGATFLAQPGGSSAGTTRTVPRDEPPPEREPPRSSRRDRDDYDDDYDDRPSRVRKRRRRDLEPHRGGLILALGIISFFFAPLILGPIAWILGNIDLAAIRAGRMDPEGESQTSTGRLCGMIATIVYGVLIAVILVVYAVCCIIGLMASAGSAGSRPRNY